LTPNYLPDILGFEKTNFYFTQRFYKPSQKIDVGRDRSGGEICTGGILKYFEGLNFASNKDMGQNDFKSCRAARRRWAETANEKEQ
jgi:hypothetical protein